MFNRITKIMMVVWICLTLLMVASLILPYSPFFLITNAVYGFINVLVSSTFIYQIIIDRKLNKYDTSMQLQKEEESEQDTDAGTAKSEPTDSTPKINTPKRYKRKSSKEEA